MEANNRYKRIVFVTILNNYSGSLNVLSIILRGLVERGYEIELITSKGQGFLSNIAGVKYHYVDYSFSENNLVTMINLFIAHIQLFFKIVFSKDKSTLYYLNTITPFSAAWACKISGKPLVYHVHENMLNPSLLYKIYRYTFRKCSSKAIFVSNYVKTTAPIYNDDDIIHNSLSLEFANQAFRYLSQQNRLNSETILFVGSLKRFKGIYEFIEIAKRMPAYKFEVVVNASSSEVDNFIREVQPSANTIIHPVCTDLHPFYQRAKLLLQLTHPDVCIETFGLTILEAMTYAIPVIGPNAGGPLELIDDGVTGYSVNTYDIDDIIQKIDLLMTNEHLYDQLSRASINKSKAFGYNKFIRKIENVITK